MESEYVYVLCEDQDMTLHSRPWPVKFVAIEQEAKDFVKDADNREYYKLPFEYDIKAYTENAIMLAAHELDKANRDAAWATQKAHYATQVLSKLQDTLDRLGKDKE